MRRPTYANVTATVAIFLALGGAAVAAKRYLINSKSQINPRVIRELHGNNGAQGPSGSPGAQGPGGPAGPPGPAGPSNLSGIQVVYSPIERAPPKEVGSAIAFCPPGTTAVSGGGSGTIASIVSSLSEPSRVGWFIVVVNEFAKPQEIYAQVLCAGRGQAIAASTRGAERKRMEAHVAALVAKLRAEKAAAGR
jgi:hypothetical protein